MGYECPPVEGFVCPWTGERFINRDLALQLSPNCEGALNTGNRSVLTGELSEQIGSQYWMDANPEGKIINEPPLAVKQALSSAEYAAGWLGTYVQSIPSNVSINPRLQTIQRYPVTLGTAELWQDVPELKPPTYEERNGYLSPDSVTYSGVASRPGGEADVQTSREQNDSISSNGNVVTGVSSLKSAMSNIPYMILAVIILIGLAFIAFGSKVGKVTA